MCGNDLRCAEIEFLEPPSDDLKHIGVLRYILGYVLRSYGGHDRDACSGFSHVAIVGRVGSGGELAPDGDLRSKEFQYGRIAVMRVVGRGTFGAGCVCRELGRRGRAGWSLGGAAGGWRTSVRVQPVCDRYGSLYGIEGAVEFAGSVAGRRGLCWFTGGPVGPLAASAVPQPIRSPCRRSVHRRERWRCWVYGRQVGE